MLQKFRNSLQQIRLGERGASSVEYLIVVGLIAFAVYTAFQQFGSSVSSKVSSAQGKVDQMTFN